MYFTLDRSLFFPWKMTFANIRFFIAAHKMQHQHSVFLLSICSLTKKRNHDSFIKHSPQECTLGDVVSLAGSGWLSVCSLLQILRYYDLWTNKMGSCTSPYSSDKCTSHTCSSLYANKGRFVNTSYDSHTFQQLPRETFWSNGRDCCQVFPISKFTPTQDVWFLSCNESII